MAVCANPPDAKPFDSDSFPGHLNTREIFWRDHQPWLQGCGYMLRRRYRSDWIPSWLGTNGFFITAEDGLQLVPGIVIDAIRIRDNMDVALKLVDVETHEFERRIGRIFSSPRLSDPRNHCVPILEELKVPDSETQTILVMPLLRSFLDPRFDTFGEVMDFFGQIFEGLKFMHDRNVAHRDCNGSNIMMDGSKMFPQGFHPQHPRRKRDINSGPAKFYTRTQCPPKYYFTDFGISRVYSSKNVIDSVIRGGDRTVPEYKFLGEDGLRVVPCNPFPVDIYFLGNMIRTNFLDGDEDDDYENRMYGLDIITPLVNDMTAEDPASRPTIDEVVERFAEIRKDLSSWKLRSHFPFPLHRIVKHWYLRVGYILRRVPAIPIASARE
ncbi:hypothetical protein C8R43DRAFT_1086966 [Mycena crocata]|nr:hypothetical protein C8R43DRAFT_1086966 [Mycena crocata]